MNERLTLRLSELLYQNNIVHRVIRNSRNNYSIVYKKGDDVHCISADTLLQDLPF